MRRASWILGAFAAVMLAGCGGGNRQQDTVGGTGAETGTGTMGGDTSAMGTGAATMDTALTDTGTGMDTAGDTATAP